MVDTGKHIKAVIFDMGGVLLRTIDPGPRTRLAQNFGLNRQQLEAIVFQSAHAIAAEEGKITLEAHWQAVAADLGMDASILPEFIAQYWAGDAENIELLEFIQSLKPQYSTALLSNAWSGIRERVLKQYRFLGTMDQVIFSSEVGLRKPDAKIYAMVLERLGVSASQAVFIDDFVMNIEAAEEAGIKAIRFIDTAQAVEEIKKAI